MSRSKVKGLLAAGMMAVAALAYLAPNDGDTSEPVSRAVRQPRTASAAANGKDPSAFRLAFRQAGANSAQEWRMAGLFGVQTLAPTLPPVAPPVVTAATVAPTAPVAPALPYTYLGRYREDTREFVILQRGNRVVVASEGELLDPDYRLEQINSDAVTIAYLPLPTTQTLSTRSNP